MIVILFIFLTSISLFFLLNKTSYIFDLLDYPNERKLHDKPTPFVGGIGISLSFLFVVAVTNFPNINQNFLLINGFFISIVGLIDDKLKLNVGGKISLQVLVIFLMLYQSGLFLEDLGNYYFLGTIELGSFNLLFTILCILLLINSFNYIDGIDGCATIIFLSFMIYIIIFSFILDIRILNYLFYISIPALIFLFFNCSFFGLPKIFLGDSGSLLLGFIMSFLLIMLYKNYNLHPSILIWSVAFVVYEFLSTNLSRLLLKKKIFSPGKDHIHYLINEKTNSTLRTNCIIVLINLFFYTIGVFIYFFLQDLLSLIMFVTFFFIFFYLRFKLLIKK